MNQALEYLMQQIRGAWRFRGIALLLAWVVCVVGWLVVLALPDTYSAWARVYIDTRTRLSQVTQGIAVESNMVAQAEAVREALLGGPELAKVARLTLPGFAKADPEGQAEIVQALRASLDVQGSNEREVAGQNHLPADLYTITYTSRNRTTAKRVVDQLLRVFLADSLGGTQEGSEQAQQFLVQQIADYDKKLGDAESRLAQYKRDHAGLLPGTTGDYFTRLHTESDELEKDRLTLSMAEQKRDELRRQIAGELPVAGVSASGMHTGPLDTASAVREAQAHLDDLLLRFTDNHPDVIAARRTLEELKQRQKTELEAIRRGDPAAIAASGLAASPVYQAMKLQLSQADIDVATARQAVADQEQKIAEQRKMINTAPEVEAEYERLNRDYAVTHTEYQALVDRLSRAKLSDRADATGVVRFEVVDPPTVDADPVFPNRPRLILAVLLGGLAAGLGAAYLLHQLRPVFSSTRQLMELTQLPVLGSISMTWPERHHARARRAVWSYALGTVLLIALGIVTLLTNDIASQFLHGVIA
jgi:polysaccharide chain length determinant protein (PEP-CTERM system associated)